MGGACPVYTIVSRDEPTNGCVSREEVGLSMRGLQRWGALLLLVNSVILLIPALYTGLSAATQQKPWVQILLGVVGVIVALALVAGKQE